jgi:hypothetical protein
MNTKSKTDKEEPKRVLPRTESVLLANPAGNLILPKTAKFAPRRAKALTDIVDPRCKKSRTDKVDPRRAMLRIDIVEP